LQAHGRAENASIDADIFAKNEYTRIILHRAGKC
jgi:hypothetical protein